MKKIIIYSVPVTVSLSRLILAGNTFNPLALKGPDFLWFYLILLSGFYASAFVLKACGESFSKVTFYGIVFIFILGIIGLIKGIVLGKPIGFLMLILLLELIVLSIIRPSDFNIN